MRTAASATREWEARGVGLADVLQALSRIDGHITRAELKDTHPHPRNCTVNLVGVASGEEGAHAIEEAAAAVAAHHPLRLIALATDGTDGPSVDARVSTHVHDLTTGRHVQAELVRLRTDPDLNGRFESMVEPLLVADVPTVLWWTGTPPFGSEELEEATGLADLFIIDSTGFGGSARSLAALARMVADGVPACDLGWWRLREWMHLSAQLFNRTRRRELLDRVRSVTIEHGSADPGQRAGAALLAGWFRSRLETAGREPIAVKLQAGAGGSVAGGVGAVAIACEGGGEDAGFRLELVAGGTQVEVMTRLGGAQPLVERLAFSVPGDAELLVEAVVAPRHDAVYAAALAAATAGLGKEA